MHELLENLLQWARSQTGNLKFSPTNFDFKELVMSNVDLMTNLAKDKKNTLSVLLNSETYVYADWNMMDTVIRNLLTNAIKFTENGRIEILAAHQGNEVIIKIVDSGIGMDRETMDGLFSLGPAKSTSGTQNEPGTGLGLIICKEFIGINGGRMEVESKKGEGSIFTIILPAAK